MPTLRELRASWPAAFSARLGTPRPLSYSAELTHDAAQRWDVPPFVRAASALRRWGDRHVVVQDDVNALAVRASNTDQYVPRLLPQGAAGRRRFEEPLGNKHHKWDLEAAAVLPDGRLLVLGSGSTETRQMLLLLEPAGALHVVDGRALYTVLREENTFSGSQLNIEGAWVSAGCLKLLQRGNGPVSSHTGPVNAIGDLPLEALLEWLDRAGPTPRLRHVTRVDLGDLGGARLGFTDAAPSEDPEVVSFLCSAEASPDAVADGAVAGSCFGRLEADRVVLTQITDAEGAPSALKFEGLESCPDEDQCFEVVADVDDPTAPALIARLSVRGPARSQS